MASNDPKYSKVNKGIYMSVAMVDAIDAYMRQHHLSSMSAFIAQCVADVIKYNLKDEPSTDGRRKFNSVEEKIAHQKRVKELDSDIRKAMTKVTQLKASHKDSSKAESALMDLIAKRAAL